MTSTSSSPPNTSPTAPGPVAGGLLNATEDRPISSTIISLARFEYVATPPEPAELDLLGDMEDRAEVGWLPIGPWVDGRVGDMADAFIAVRGIA